MRVAFLVVALAASVLPVRAQSVKVERIDIVDRGIYEIATGAQTPSANTPTGTVTATSAEKLVMATTTVPGKVGLEFGFRYVVAGSPAGGDAPLDIVITYPPERPGRAGADARRQILADQDDRRHHLSRLRLRVTPGR